MLPRLQLTRRLANVHSRPPGTSLHPITRIPIATKSAETRRLRAGHRQCPRYPTEARTYISPIASCTACVNAGSSYDASTAKPGYSFSTARDGIFTYTVIAIDRAGNTYQASVAYTVSSGAG